MATPVERFILHAAGNWSPGQFVIRWVDSSRKIIPEVEAKIDDTWSRASSRLGDRLFDGPMCRMERFDAGADRFELHLSHTSYKPFLGTNLSAASELVDRFGANVLANPVGLSTLLLSCDGWLLFGRRNGSVAYYPHRVHPFAGSLEPRDDLDLFAEVRRELGEEVGLESSAISDLRCIGLAEDTSIRQPEMVFWTSSTLTRNQIESNLDRNEHDAIVGLRADRESVGNAMDDASLTPIAAASLELWTRWSKTRTVRDDE